MNLFDELRQEIALRDLEITLLRRRIRELERRRPSLRMQPVVDRGPKGPIILSGDGAADGVHAPIDQVSIARRV